MPKSKPTHDHLHVPGREGGSAVDYLEDNSYRRNSLPRTADWTVVSSGSKSEVKLPKGFEVVAPPGSERKPLHSAVPSSTHMVQYITSMQKSSVTTDWGQDWDEWMNTRPAYDANGHQLGFDPSIHPEGKGFILDNGSVWTWPTYQMRPQHMEYDYKAKRLGLNQAPGTAFHIDPRGGIYQIGEGRSLSPEQRALIEQADPRLDASGSIQPDLSQAPQGYGHGNRLLDILRDKGTLARSLWEELDPKTGAPLLPPQTPTGSGGRHPRMTDRRQTALAALREPTHATASRSSLSDWH